MSRLILFELTPLLHKDEINSTECSIKKRFQTFLGYFLKATLGLIQGMALILRPSLSGEGLMNPGTEFDATTGLNYFATGRRKT